MIAETITPENEAAWLVERMNSVGASEAAAALGVCPYTSPIDLWQRKLNLAPAVIENEAMSWGKKLEPLVIAEYEQRTGRTVGCRQQFIRHPQHHFVTATIDGMADNRLVEVKTTGRWNPEWGDEDTDQIPENYLVQVAQQMAVTGAALADVAVLIGGQQLRIYTVERDETLVNAVVSGVSKFWSCVENREPPTWGRMDAAALAVINPECFGDTEIPPTMFADVWKYESIGKQIKELETEREAAKLRLLEFLGCNRTGKLPDGRIVRRYLEQVAERTQTVKAHTKHYFCILKGTSK